MVRFREREVRADSRPARVAPRRVPAVRLPAPAVSHQETAARRRAAVAAPLRAMGVSHQEAAGPLRAAAGVLRAQAARGPAARALAAPASAIIPERRCRAAAVAARSPWDAIRPRYYRLALSSWVCS